MASDSSPPRIRAKTLDFTGFFRGAGHTSYQKQKEPSVNLEAPSSDSEPEARSKKKFSGIHIFGRSRKILKSISARDLAELSVRAPSSDR